MVNHDTPPELAPRYATARNHHRDTDGANVAKVAELLGKPFLPWQRLVVDVASEIDPHTGTYFYDTIVVTVQRQAGKSTSSICYQLRNALWNERRRIWYLAQTGKDANTQFKEWIDDIKHTRLQQLVRNVRLSNGSMSLTLRNNSQIIPGASTDTAGHGRQGDLIIADEYFSLSKQKEKNLVAGFLPTTTTRMQLQGVRPQYWIMSTEGTAESEALNERLDTYRAGNIPERTAFFDFGIPFDSDPEDLETVWRYHPASGRLFQFDQLKDFREQFKTNPAEWARAFGNLRDKGVTERVISQDVWQATAITPVDPSKAEHVCFGVAVEIGAASTSIVAAFEHEGRTIVQLVETLGGIGSAPARLKQLQERYNASILIDFHGTSAPLADVLRNAEEKRGRATYNLVKASSTDIIAAPQAFLSALEDHNVLHATDTELDYAASNATARSVGDAWVWQRKAVTSVAPIEASALALWGLRHTEVKPSRIQVF